MAIKIVYSLIGLSIAPKRRGMTQNSRIIKTTKKIITRNACLRLKICHDNSDSQLACFVPSSTLLPF